MKTTIRCVESKRGTNSFYVNVDGYDYYLFSQDFHVGVNKYFKNGVRVNAALKPNTGDHCIDKTKQKMKAYIKYIEKEFKLKILNETINKGRVNPKAYKRNEQKYQRFC